MGELKVEYVPIGTIRPYAGNAKLHPRSQIEQIKESIELMGFKDPIGVWKGEIVEGHGRYIAAQELGMDEVPIIRLDDLTDEQRRAYGLIHNKLTMNSDFDYEILPDELSDIRTFDMGDFGFDIDEIMDIAEAEEEEHQKNRDDTQFAKANIENLEYAQFRGDGKYDIPQILPVTELPEIKEWISFNYVLTDPDPTGKAVHFFIDDYQFARVWNNPDAYLEKLKQYVCVASPDFSPYGDMPICLQLYNHYRKHWCAAYWQMNGITVIPTLRASTDKRSREWWLDGEPYGGIVMVSEMWASKQNDAEASKAMNDEIIEKLNPRKWFVYGKGNKEIYDGMNVEFISTFTEKRW